MEPNNSSQQSSQDGHSNEAIKKAESATEFDALYSMDALSLQQATQAPSKPPTPINNGKMLAGSSFPRTPVPNRGQAPPAHSFSECQSSSFSLRVGPNYAKLGNKAPAGLSLYESVGADFVRCQSRIDDFASKVNLPEDWVNIDTHHPYIPQLFVVNVQLPEDFSNSFFTTKTDGVGWSLVLYFRIRQETADALKDLSTAPNSVRLFAQYCMEAPEYFAASAPPPAHAARSNHTAHGSHGHHSRHGSKSSAHAPTPSPPPLPEGPNPWIGRFKIILRCEDIEQFGLPSFITAYNSKPVLIRSTGTLMRGAHYVEFDINVHKFASLPKRALEAMFTRFDKMVFSAGFCVESRADEEMPESLFGAVQINFPTHQRAPQWQQPP